MKKMRLHIYIAIAVFVAMIIVGSFLDLQINQALISPNNGFGLSIAAISMNVGYGVIAFMGGICAYHAIKIEKVTWIRIFSGLCALAFLGTSIYFDGGEFFGPNGWYNPSIEFVGYIIAAVIMGGCCYLGYLAGKKANNPRIWLLMVVGALFIVLALVIGTTVVKGIFHRPRFRYVVYEYNGPFFAWWERCTNYKDLRDNLINVHGFTMEAAKEEFKSFPSGHTSVCAISMLGVIILPFIFGKEIKRQVLYFYLALVYTLFIAFTRLLVGAHYLSDVGMGGLITLLCLYGYYEVILHNPKLYEVKELEVKAEDGSNQ